MAQIADLFINLDAHLSVLTLAYGPWIYGLIFLTIFAETGLVVTPFLPGDSLLFAAGALAAQGFLSSHPLALLLLAAAVLGDAANYWLGHYFGLRVFKHENSRFFRRDYLERTHRFYEKYGAKTVVLSRFIPIIRTFAPFVAGIGRMPYYLFTFYNIIGGIAWIIVFFYGGLLFGNLSFVKDNFSLVVAAIIATSFLPAITEFWRAYRSRHSSRQTSLPLNNSPTPPPSSDSSSSNLPRN